MENKVSLTKTTIEGIPMPRSGRVTYHDTKLPGFQLRVTSKGRKTFSIRTNLNRRTIRITLGTYPKMSAEEARKQAKHNLSIIASGKNPNARRLADHARAITIQQCLEDYISSRTSLKSKTAKGYQNTLNQYLQDWMDKPLIGISRDDIEHRHKKIGGRSPTRANSVMRILRALFEYAHGKYEDEDGNPVFLHNPVKRLSHSKAWYRETRRQTFIKLNDLKAWFDAVNSAPKWLECPYPELIRDYLLLVLFTGLRRSEAASLRWEWIDFDQNVLTIPETKNGYPHSLPLTSFLIQILKNRYPNNSEYVFPGTGKTGHFIAPKRPLIKIRERSGISFCIHDLRRTFITIAESQNIRDYTLKRLLNHRSGGDVTDGYIMTDVDRLRAPMQQITDTILKAVNITTHKKEKSDFNNNIYFGTLVSNPQLH